MVGSPHMSSSSSLQVKMEMRSGGINCSTPTNECKVLKKQQVKMYNYGINSNTYRERNGKVCLVIKYNKCLSTRIFQTW
jgi:hypothetical protein